MPGQGLAKRPEPEAVSCNHRRAHGHTDTPHQFIAIARTIGRGFTEQAVGHPEGEALTEAAQAIWRGTSFLREWIGAHYRARSAPCGGRCQPHRSPLAD
jgi:hypothetical protein